MRTATLTIGVLLLAASPCVQAQSSQTARPATAATSTQHPRDGVFVAGGSTWLARYGTARRLVEPVSLANGVRVTAAGIVEMRDGRRVALRPGQMVTMAGEIITLSAPQVSSRMAVRPLEGILILDGRAWLTRAGRMERLGTDLRLRSGVIVQPNGRLRMPDGTSSQLGHGQLLTFSGQIRNPGGNPAGSAPIRSYPRDSDTPTTGTSQATFTGDVAPNPPTLLGPGMAAD